MRMLHIAGIGALAAATAVILATLAWATEPTPQEKCQSAMRFYAAAHTQNTIEVLELLQEGQISEAIEKIEENDLGINLAELKLPRDTGSPVPDLVTTVALRRAIAYRDKYPRVHSDPEIERAIRDSLAQIQDSANSAPPARSDHP